MIENITGTYIHAEESQQFFNPKLTVETVVVTLLMLMPMTLKENISVQASISRERLQREVKCT